MSWNLSYAPESHRIDLYINGELSPGEMRRATDEALALVDEHGCLGVLIDCRDLHPTPLPSAVKRLPELYAARKLDRRVRIAVLKSGSEAGAAIAQYYKMAARRLDYVVDLFEDISDALDWLAREAGCR